MYQLLLPSNKIIPHLTSNRAGHRVVAVEEESQWFSSARLSSSISAFHLLPDPLASQEAYTNALVRIAKREGVNLYVPACGVATTICDGIAKPVLEAFGVQVLQFDADLGRKLDKKDLFMQMCQDLGLKVPLTTLVHSVDEVMAFDFDGKGKGKGFLMKCVGVDDKTRNDMTLFPLADREYMRRRLSELNISVENPFILQEFVSGVEYLT
jgi:predicted ATP-grasp superfamily ATP-dependent carboligase